MRRYIIGRWLLGLCAIGLLIGGAGRLNAAAERKIGVVLLTREHFFFREMETGLNSAAKKYGYKSAISYAEFDSDKQDAMVRQYIAQKVNALILAPCNSVVIGETILKANKAGIPVFTVDIANLSGKGKVVTHIASDNLAGGYLAGRLMFEALKGNGKVVIINHPKITSTADRISGFREYLKERKGIEIVAEIPGWGQRSRAMAAMEDFLMMMPDINGVFAINDDSAIGALQAIEAAGKAGKIAIVGYDATPEAQKYIVKGKIYGDVIQYPREMGQLVIKTIRDYFDGKAVKPLIPVKVGIFSRGNHR